MIVTMVPTTTSTPPVVPRKRHWLLYGCGALLGLVLLLAATVFVTIWWIQRPIKPVVLSAKEKATVDEKLRHIEGANSPAATNGSKPSPTITPGPYRPIEPAPTPEAPTGNAGNERQDHPYQPGSKTLRLTEREINGLLNANTDLGKSVRLEFTRDAINAYLVVPIPQDFPVGGGKMFRARGRFRVSLGNEGAPYAILEDVTVFGLALPKAWLGGLKGENLLADATGRQNGKPALRGIKSLHVEPGALVLEVED
jgi:hypothetical protein